MSTATTLPQAAGLAFDNLQVLWLIPGLLKQRLGLFCDTSLPFFLDQDVNGRPVANWLTVLSTLADLMPVSDVPIELLTQAAEYVYRVCWMGNTLRVANLITATQASNLLGNYNGQFG
jgi:hypothetical protein